MLFILLTNIFFSVKGNNIKPININKGNFTKSHIGMYVGGRLLENIHFPNVRVQTLLKKLFIYSMESKINKGFFQKTG